MIATFVAAMLHTDFAENLVLVTFRIRGLDGDSRHSSIWDLSAGHPVMRFHQGTAVA